MAKVFLSVIISIMTALLSVFSVTDKMKAPADTSDFVPVIRFAVMSDTHIQSYGDEDSHRIAKAMSMAYSDAAADPNYTALDAVMFCGDLTNSGTKWQYNSFVSAVNAALKDGTQFLAVNAKSHDCNTLGKAAIAYTKSITTAGGDWHYVINGYHFIGVSTSEEDSVQYSEAQRAWVSQQLDAATAEDPEKPIFFTHHEHVSDTVYGSAAGEWGVDAFKDIFEDYPQLVHFSGHSHYPLNDPRSIWQGEFTAVGTGAIYYMEFTVDDDHPVHPENYEKTGQFWLVEVDKDNEVRLRGYDIQTGELLCEYILSDLSDASARQYTPAQRESVASAPEFAEGAALSVKSTAGKYKVTAPAAVSTDGDIVFLYRVSVTDGAGNVTYSEYKVNNYWLGTQTYDSVTFTVSADAGSTITVTAENAYGMQGTPLTYTVG